MVTRKLEAGAARLGPQAGALLVLLLLASWTAAVPLFTQTLGVRQETSAPVLRAELANGLQVVIVRNGLAPAAATVVNYRVGSNEAPEGFPGTAHALEHMMFRGSPGLTANQLSAIAAALGGDFNAATRQSATQYFFTVPAEDLELALRIEAIRMSGFPADEKSWELERGAIEQEVARNLSNPQYIFYSRLLAALFQGTVYAHDALGSRESFQKTSAGLLKRFYDTWYVPNNAILVIVGDVDPARTLDQVRRLFEPIRPGELPERPPARFQPVQPQTLRLDTDLPYGLAVVAFRLPGTDSPDYAATQILADALGSQRGSLYALVPEDKALFAGFSLIEMPAASVGYAVASFPQGADGEALAGALKEILAAGVSRGVSPDLVEAARRQEIAGLEFQKNSIYGLAMAWSQAVAVEGRDSPEEVVRALRQVTVPDVDRVAREQLDLAHAVTAVLTPRPAGVPTTGESFGGQESFTPQSVQPVALPGWAEQALGRLAVPDSAVHPEVSALPNGLRLIVQTETISDTVSLYGRIDSNPYLQVPAGQEGASRLLDRLFEYGTTGLDRLAYQAALDEIAADVSAGTDFSLQVLSDHFERGVQLLADLQLHPALPEAAFQTVRSQLAAEVAGELQSPEYRAQRAMLAALLPAGDPALREATPETITSLTLENVRDYHRKVFRPDMTTIVAIGNITPAEARRVVEERFGSWAAAGPKPDTRLRPVAPNPPAQVRAPNPSRVQDRVMLSQTLGLNRSHPDYYPLELGNRVLGDGFYATRLYHDLREATGLVYSVDSALDVGRSRGFYSVEFASDPANVPRVRSIVIHNLRQMQEEAVSEAELRQAKSLLLREIPLAEASIRDVAGGLLYRVENDLSLDEPTRAARRYLELSARQVQEAFRKWIRPGDLVQVTEGPAPP
jgi:zinc protease